VVEPNVVVLGVGNLLMRDEGVGVHIVQALLEEDVPEYVSVFDAGTAALDVLCSLERPDLLVVTDAVDGGCAPGAIHQLTLDEAGLPEGTVVSLHDVGVREAIAMAEALGREPRRTSIVGIEPAEISWGLELTPAVQAAVPEAVNVVLDQIRRWRGERRRTCSSPS